MRRSEIIGDKNKMLKTAKKDRILENISREIHGYMSYSTISMYYAIKKLLDTNLSNEEYEKTNDLINKMMITAESLYDNLTDKQKELMKNLALRLYNIAKGKE